MEYKPNKRLKILVGILAVTAVFAIFVKNANAQTVYTQSVDTDTISHLGSNNSLVLQSTFTDTVESIETVTLKFTQNSYRMMSRIRLEYNDGAGWLLVGETACVSTVGTNVPAIHDLTSINHDYRTHDEYRLAISGNGCGGFDFGLIHGVNSNVVDTALNSTSGFTPFVTIEYTEYIPPEPPVGYIPIYTTDLIQSVTCDTEATSTDCTFTYATTSDELSQFEDKMLFIAYLMIILAYFGVITLVFRMIIS